MKKSQNLNRSALLVSSLTIFCRILGFARDTVIARYLGASGAADSFFASFKLSNLFRKIFGEGALFSGFVPVFTKINANSKEEAMLFSSRVFTIITIALLLVVALSEIFMDKVVLIICPGFTGEKLQYAIQISKITFPYFYFITSCSVLWGVLNSAGIFFYYGFVPAILSIVMIFFGLALKNHFNDIAICFSYALLVGGVFQLIVSYVGCLLNGFKITFTKPVMDANVKKVFKKMFNTTISTSLTQINTIIDGILASFIASAVSYLYYADRIFYFPFSIVGITLSIVSLPAISKAVAQGDKNKNISLQNLAVKLILLYGLPAAVAMFFVAPSLTKTIFEYGDFTNFDTKCVAIIASIFACGLFFALANRFLSVLFFANSNTKTPMKITILGVLVNLTLSLLLVKVIGVYGIAIATSSSYFVSAAVMFIILKRRGYLLLDSSIKQFTLKIAISCILLAFACFVFNKIFMLLQLGFVLRVLYLTLFGIFCGALYVASLYLLKINILKITFSKNSF